MKTLCTGTNWPRLSALTLGLSLSLFVAPSFAVHEDAFELEGNAVDNPVGGPADGRIDWETLYLGGGSPLEFTGIIPDTPNPDDDTVFTGGRKDIQDISEWGHKTGSSPDKDEITNAYAAAFKGSSTSPDDVVVYFGADRISNKGDAFIGYWFFKNHVEPLSDGSFTGSHVNGDVLVLTNFPQASGASPEIRVAVWDSSCSKAANNDPAVGQCAAKNLKLIVKAAANCNDALADDFACARTNDEGGSNDPTPSPWPFQSKNSGTADEFPYESFFEGGINLTQLLGGDSCFSSFMAETRSSSEFTATLKDFVLRDFELCGGEISKTCKATELLSGNVFNIDYTLMLENTGTGAVPSDADVKITDRPNGKSAEEFVLNLKVSDFSGGADGWQAGEKISYMGYYTSDVNGGTNDVEADVSFGTLSFHLDQYTAMCDALPLSPRLAIKKTCALSLQEQGGLIAVLKHYDIKVCNRGEVPLDVELSDSDTTLESGDAMFSLDIPKECSVDADCSSGYSCGPADNGKSYCRDAMGNNEGKFGGAVCHLASGDYNPSSLPSGTDGTLSNTATAKATSSVVDTGDLGTVGNSSTAMCDLCPLDDGSN